MQKYTLFLLVLLNTFNYAQDSIRGCMCEAAKNFNPNAKINDGSCKYKSKKLKPFFSQILDNQLHETSGLIKFNNQWVTHNDDSENWLYFLNENSFEIENILKLDGLKNVDWESISQDSTHFYIGDFGNNKGNRTDLSIYKIQKNNIFENPQIEVINFHYANQKSFEKANRKNNFDCEAFIVKDSSIVLFTKNWIDQTCDIYVLPNKNGINEAKFVTSFNSNGLITDACYLPEKQTILLTGYNKKLKPFIIKINFLNDLKFSEANFKRFKINLPFHQVEAIYSEDGETVWLTNEKFTRKKFMIDIPQKIHAFKLD